MRKIFNKKEFGRTTSKPLMKMMM